MPLMFLPFIMFAGFWKFSCSRSATTPVPARAKTAARQPRHRDIDI